MNKLGMFVYFVLMPFVAFLMLHYIYQFCFSIAGYTLDIPLWLQILLSFPFGYCGAWVCDYRNTCPYHTEGLIRTYGWDGELR
jgi:hypothetical protein